MNDKSNQIIAKLKKEIQQLKLQLKLEGGYTEYLLEQNQMFRERNEALEKLLGMNSDIN